MAIVFIAAIVTIFIFATIQLFHFVEQRKVDYVQQLENLTRSVREPITKAVLNVDVVKAQKILDSLVPIGILTRADLVLPNKMQALNGHFPVERPVPMWVTKLFNLPVRVSTPIYSLGSNMAVGKPMAYLLLQVDSFRIYQFILFAISTMVSTYLLLALVLTIAISWCMNRLLVKPLRRLAKELQDPSRFHQLTLPPSHGDDELGLLVRNYNRNQQVLAKAHTAMYQISAPALQQASIESHKKNKETQPPSSE